MTYIHIIANARHYINMVYTTYPGIKTEVSLVPWKAQLPMDVTPLANRIRKSRQGT